VPGVSTGEPVVLAFAIIPVLLAASFATGVWFAWRRTGATSGQAARAAVLVAAGAGIWMLVTWRLAASGLLLVWDAVPPPFAFVVLGVLVLAFRIAFSGLGRRLAAGIPLWVLVAVQGFRLPLEIAMHGMAERGVMPVQMSYSGLNFDIVTGASALVVAGLLATGRAGRRLAAAWNILGLVLLTNIVAIAIASTPAFAAFGPDRLNVWVMYPPYIWLPTVMVLTALAGHLVIWRALRATR
jgi:hypothetical protein